MERVFTVIIIMIIIVRGQVNVIYSLIIRLASAVCRRHHLQFSLLSLFENILMCVYFRDCIPLLFL